MYCFEGLNASQVEEMVTRNVNAIFKKVNESSSLDEIEKAFDELEKYNKELYSLRQTIVDMKTAYYMYNEEIYKAWDGCLMNINACFYENKESLISIYRKKEKTA